MHKPSYIVLTFIYAAALCILLVPQSTVAQLCWPDQCGKGTQKITDIHQQVTEDIIHDNDSGYGGYGGYKGDSFDGQLLDFQRWLVPDLGPGPGPLIEPAGTEGFWRGHPIRALRLMTRQLSAFAMKQALMVGALFDAQNQIETQRLHQILIAEAHRDYTPSQDFCYFGTNVRGMAASEMRGRFNSLALNKYMMNRHLGTAGTAAALSQDEDINLRWQKFKTTYCNPQDNNWNGNDGSGLETACGEDGGGETERINLDIDYGRLMSQRRTLDLSFDNTGPTPPTDREDVIAMAQNLFGHRVLTRDIQSREFVDDQSREKMRRLYLSLRSVAARRNVAENSFNALVEMKSAGGIEDGQSSSAREFLAAILLEAGIEKDEIFTYIGENPSYYAQLEILAKKIYQRPDFFVDLYDKPANVQRKSVALKAIELMLDRAIFESHLRREMATSVLLSSKLHGEYSRLNNDVINAGGAK